MADAPVEFTRGGVGAPDTRGSALVARHAEARAAAAADAASAELAAAFPGVPRAVLAAAAAETGQSASAAAPLVAAFWEAHAADVRSVYASEGVPLAGGEVGAPRSASPSSSSSSGGRKRRRRKSSKSDKRERKKEKKDRSKRSRRRRSRSRERERSRDQSRERSPRATAADAYGKYGILRPDADADAKRSEFWAWAADVMKVDLEAAPTRTEQDLWRTFCEDYNTATLPHRKYYDLAKWAAEEAAAAAKKGGGAKDKKASAADDEAALRRARDAARADAAAARLKDAYNALKYSDAGKVESMRDQARLRAELASAHKTGDADKAAALTKRLAPDKKG